MSQGNVAYPTQGRTLAFRSESALGTGTGTLVDFRHTEPTLPTDTRKLVKNPNEGHAHSFDVGDHGIELEIYREGEMSFSTEIRGPATPGGKPPIVSFFESAGCTATAMTGDTTISTGAAVDDLPLTDDYGGYGLACAVELAGSKYFPTLMAGYAASAATPSMDLPSAPADGATVANMYCIVPSTGPIGATDSLEFVVNTRGTHTTGQDLSVRYNGCAVTGVGELTLKYGEAPKLQFTVGTGKLVEESTALAAEAFGDSAKMAVVNDNFEAAYSAYDMAGGITRAVYDISEVKFSWGFKLMPIQTSGAGSFAGLQGWIQVPDGEPTLTVTGFYDKRWMALLENQADTYKYFHFVQPAVFGEGNECAWGLWLPKCRLSADAPAVHDFLAEDFIKSTTTWACSADVFTGGGSKLDSNNASAPWYFGLLHGTMD